MSESLRWMVTGAGGMVGSDVAALLRRDGDDLSAFTRAELDITSRDAILSRAREANPDVILNCAAFTRVDDCEARPEWADLANGTSVGYLAEAADAAGALLVQISTDFVFDGSAAAPYREEQPVAPLSAYGRSKLLGEREAARAERHLIVRTSWLFGRSGPNFVEAIRRQVDGGNRALRVVDDQRGRPTYTPHLAEALTALVRSGAHGVVHYADAPECTWYDFAVEIVRLLGARDVDVKPVSTDEFPRPARRPAYSVLATERYEELTGSAPRSWKEGLREYLSSSRA